MSERQRVAVRRESQVLENILFCSSVLMFAAAAILAYWQIARARIDETYQAEQVPQGVPVEPAQPLDVAA